MQSTHGAAHNNRGSKREEKKILNREPSFISETALKLCFVSQLSAIISISRLHESDSGGRGGGGKGTGG